MATGFPSPTLVNIPQDGIIPVSGSLLNSTYDVIPPGLREGTLHSWNVAFQRQLPFRSDRRHRLRRQPRRESGDGRRRERQPRLRIGQRRPAAVRRLQPHRDSRVRSNENKSEYNALQVKVDRRFQNGLMITNSYTFSRSKDYANENTGIGTPIDFDLSWARSNFDRTHNYVLTSIYELPWGPGKSGWAKARSARSSAAGS